MRLGYLLVLVAIGGGCNRVFTFDRHPPDAPPPIDAPPPDVLVQPSGVAVERYTIARGSFTTKVVASHEVGFFTGRLLFVAVSLSFAGTLVSGVTYGSSPLTRVGFRDAANSDGRIELWSLPDPPTGTADVTITLDDTSSSAVAGIGSFSGVGSLGTFTSAVGSMGSPTVAVASAPDQLVLGFVMWNGGNYSTLTSNTPQERWNENEGGIVGAGNTCIGAGTTMLSWTVVGNYNDFWAASAIAIKP